MHKKLESELVSIAHSILQMKNRNDVVALRKKAQQLYEVLSVLSFVEKYIDTTPNALENKEELVTKIEKAIIETSNKIDEFASSSAVDRLDSIEDVTNEVGEEQIKEEEELVILSEEKKDETLIEPSAISVLEEKEVLENEIQETLKKQWTLEEEFKDAVSVDVTTDMFHKAEKIDGSKASLNDTFMQKNIQVGLNDRIAFVKHLFNHSQADFNRVLSQLNSIESEKEAKKFINKMVKPDYDWSGKEEYEERLIGLIERKF